MGGTVYREDFVFRQAMLVRLEMFLQPCLGVLPATIEARLVQRALEQRQDDLFSQYGPPVEVDRSAQGLETIGENRRPRMPPRTKFSGAKLQVVAKLQHSRDCRQGFPSYERGPEAAQLALGGLRKTLVQCIRDDQSENRVAEKLQPFIVHAVGTAVSQCLLEQFPRAEGIVQTTFELAWRLPQRRTSSTLSLKEISTSTLPTIGS